MGREVRRVVKGWEHPKGHNGNDKPLFDGNYEQEAKNFLEMANKEGLQKAVDYMGCPDSEDYMPTWTDEEATQYMMYETTSEGTPISPAFDTPEELAKWLTDNGASAFATQKATYEQWLRVCTGGYACSAVISNGVIESGVAALYNAGKSCL